MIPRRLVVKAEELPIVRRCAIWLANRRYRGWAKRHAEASFGQFYAQTIGGKLARGRHHPTLGARGWEKEHGSARDWDHASFAVRGLDRWQKIKALGIEPHMRCVDYGCGSLRLGQHALRELEPGHYFGLDVSDHFFTIGLRMLDPALVAEKQPYLAAISDTVLANVREWRPDFIFSNAVLQHVPPQEIPLFFARVGRMMRPGCVACIIFVAGDSVEQFGAMSWRYPADLLAETVARTVPGLTATIEPFNSAADDPRGRERMVLRLHKHGAEPPQREGLSAEARPELTPAS